MVAIDRQDLREQVYNVLRAELVQGRLRPGERLHVAKLADRLNVSPTPVKEAISRLIPAGLVEMGPRGGAFVTPITPASVHDTIELRELLEQYAAERALPNVTDADCDRLTELCEHLLAATDHGEILDYEAFAAADMAFHAALIALAGNERLVGFYDSMQVYTIVSRAYYLLHPDRKAGVAVDDPHHSYTEHLAIVAALRAGDAAALRSAIHDHLVSVEFFALQAADAVNGVTPDAAPATTQLHGNTRQREEE